MELASLGIAVDSRSAGSERGDLDGLTAAGARAEKSMGGVGAGGRAAASGSTATANGSRSAAAAMRDQASAASQLTASVRAYAAIAVSAYDFDRVAGLADAWGQVNSRLRIAVGVGQQFNTVQTELMRVATCRRTRMLQRPLPMAHTAQVYQLIKPLPLITPYTAPEKVVTVQGWY